MKVAAIVIGIVLTLVFLLEQAGVFRDDPQDEPPGGFV